MPLGLSGPLWVRLPFCSLSFLLKFDVFVSSTEPDIVYVYLAYVEMNGTTLGERDPCAFIIYTYEEQLNQGKLYLQY